MTLRSPQSIHIDQYIEIEDVIKLLIPTETVDVLKVNKIVQAQIFENFKVPGHSLHMSSTAKKLVKGIDDDEYVAKCWNCKYFPHSFVCDKTAIDFIANGFLSFKYLSQGLEALFQNKKLAKWLASRVEVLGS